MSALVWGSILLFTALFCHSVIWHIKIPQDYNSRLIQLFGAVFIAGISFLFYSSLSQIKLFVPPPSNPVEYLHLGCLYGAGTIFYIFFHVVLIYDSPTLLIVDLVSKSGNQGLKEEELYKSITDDLLVASRMEDLVIDGMVYRENDRYKLLPKGRFLLEAVSFSRRLMNAPKLGG
ncbi:MAG TPA: hypothetical protein VM123_17740 [archaeon]|nr:hypothetical protein [archaeon]